MNLIPAITPAGRGYIIPPADCAELAPALTQLVADVAALGETVEPELQEFIDEVCAVAQAWAESQDA